MLHDSGRLTICTLKNVAAKGELPDEQLVPGNVYLYGERTVGYGRQYAAKGVSEQIDMLVEIWQDRSIRIGMYALLDANDQYRIDNVQHLYDEDGLQVTYLTLRRLDNLYNVSR